MSFAKIYNIHTVIDTILSQIRMIEMKVPDYVNV